MKNFLRNSLLYVLIAVGVLSVGYEVHAAQVAPPAALFDTILSSPEQTTDTTMTLKSASTTQGDALSGFQCFTVDTGTPTVEYECGTISGNNVINLTRNLDFLTGTTSSPSSIPYHRTGADVRQSDFPALTILSNILAGLESINQPIYYSSTTSTSTIASNRSNVASVGLLDDTAFNGAGIINATTVARGVIQIATGIQVASSTSSGSSGATLVIPASLSTSTWSATIPIGTVPSIGSIGGKIDNNFISTSTLGFANALNIQTFTNSGTWTKPSTCLVQATAYLIAGGGGGGSGGANGSGGGGGGGGSPGAVAIGTFPIANVPASVSVQIGLGGLGGLGVISTSAGNAGEVGSTTSFGGLLAAAGGTPGAAGASSGNSQGPNAGATSGTAVYVLGGGGGGLLNSAGNTGSASGMSPVSILGGVGGIASGPGGSGGSATSTWFILGGSGGGGGGSTGTGAGVGGAGGLYGGGGGGGGTVASGSSGAGGVGAKGIAVIACN